MYTLLNNTLLYWGIVATLMAGFYALHTKYATTDSYRWAYLTSIVVLPGTYMHELAHALVAFLTNAQPVKLSVVPRLDKDEETRTLGMVWLANMTWYNAVPVGLAPLLLLPMVGLACHLTTWDNPVLKGLEAYLVANMIYSCVPSSVDLAAAKQYWWGPVVIVGAVGAALAAAMYVSTRV